MNTTIIGQFPSLLEISPLHFLLLIYSNITINQQVLCVCVCVCMCVRKKMVTMIRISLGNAKNDI